MVSLMPLLGSRVGKQMSCFSRSPRLLTRWPNAFCNRDKGELEMRNKIIQKQKQVKKMIQEHEKRVEELTIKLQQVSA